MCAVALLRLIASGDFSHRVVRRCAAVLGVGFNAIPLYHQNYAAWIFDAGKKLDAVGAGVIGFLQNVAEDLDVFVALFRRDTLNDDFVDHFLLLLFQSFKTFKPIKSFNTKIPRSALGAAALAPGATGPRLRSRFAQPLQRSMRNVF